MRNLPQMKIATIKGNKFEILDKGQGEPIIFIHGGMGDECFAVLEEPLLTENYRLIYYHRRGWGKSEALSLPFKKINTHLKEKQYS